MTIIPKSIKYHTNLTESEIRAYYSLKPLDEDFADHAKRFNNILNDYVKTRDFPNKNAQYCFKRQLKTLIEEDKTNTPKFEAFNMWRISRIQWHINRQKDWLLQQEGKAPMPKNQRQLKEQQGEPVKKINHDLKINNLVEEIKELKKQLEEKDKIIKDKDNQIDYLMEENSKLKVEPMEEQVKPVPVNEIKECLIESSEEEEEVEEPKVEEPKKEIVVHFDTEEESEEESESEEEEESESEEEEEKKPKIPYNAGKFYLVRKPFIQKCKDSVKPYHEQYMKQGENMDKKERKTLAKKILKSFDKEIIQVEVNKICKTFEIPFSVLCDMESLAKDELNSKILYHSFDC